MALVPLWQLEQPPVTPTCEKRAGAPANRTVLVIFTDGLENASSATFAQAVQSISRQGACGDINGCFLVFVGTQQGLPELRALADNAGRTFVSTPSFEELKRLFLNVINDVNSCR